MFGKVRLGLIIRVAMFVCIAAALAIVTPLLVSAERLGAQSAESAPPALVPGPCAGQTANQLCAEYFNGDYTTGPATPVLVRLENQPTRNNDWGSGSPGPGVNADHFWARYTALIPYEPEVFETITYQFVAVADDGVRVWVDDDLIIDGWKDQPATTYRGVATLGDGNHTLKMEYYENTGGAVAKLGWTRVCPEGQMLAEYFDNQTLAGGPAVTPQCEALPLDHNWGTGSPVGIPNDHFSARYSGLVHAETGVFGPGAQTFVVTVDDGVRLWVDGALVLDKWFDQGQTTYRVDVPLDQGDHLVKMEYYENGGGAVAKLKGYSICPSTFRTEYYSGVSPSGTPKLVECDGDGYTRTIDRNFGSGGPGVTGVGSDNFSVIWTGAFMFQAASYTFTAAADDGVRVYLDNKLVIDQWRDQPTTTFAKAIWVPAGYHAVRMEYYERGGGAVAKLSWARTYRTEVIVDDSSSGFRKGGSPWQQTWTVGYGGHMWWSNSNGSTVNRWGEWTANLGGGSYEVFVWVPRANASTTHAPYTITYQEGTAERHVTRYVNQSPYYDRWVSLGTYFFGWTGVPQVRLTDATGEAATTRVGFDAVRFVPR